MAEVMVNITSQLKVMDREAWRAAIHQRLLMPDSPTMTPEQGRAPLATSRKTDFPSTTQEAP